jgi:outer membrane protein assembly factor BamA
MSGIDMTALLFFLMAAGSLRACAIPAAKPAAISAISVRGAIRLPANKIIDIAGLKVGGPMSQAALRFSKSRLVKSGWFGGAYPGFPERAVRVTADEAKGRVLIEVDENPVVRWIEIDDPGPLEEKDLLKLVDSKIGKMLNLNFARDDAAEIERCISRQGYKAIVPGGFRIHDGVLTFPIEVARIRSSGIEGLSPEVTERAWQAMKARPGDYFNIDALQDDYSRLSKAGLFSDLAPNMTDFGSGMHIVLRLTP